jgi:3-deoxy-D-manno-octulosonic-acid transferase
MYTFSIYLYSLLVRTAAFFGHAKAKLLAEGQKQVWTQIETRLQQGERYVWIHCSSLGEFEQGRPLMEDIRAQFPQYKILITFFSSSGYELRKNFDGADYVFYLPFDTRRNARRFIKLIHPEIIYFIKYEFWRNYLKIIKQQNIPLYLVSAIFREEQAFFKWYGGWYRKLLTAFTHFFVQNERSKELLATLGYANVTVTGDTRFDRVCRIFDRARTIPEAEQFVNGQPCIVAGSTWSSDEEMLARYINAENRNIKWIFAPHELHESQIVRLMTSVNIKAVRFSQLADKNPADYQLLVIDNFGMLSSLYRYATVAYIGGGLDENNGIHNAIEAAVYGIPVIFGRVYDEYQEAVDLVALGGAIPIGNYDEFALQLNSLLNNPEKAKKIGTVAGAFVASGRGATAKVLQASFYVANRVFVRYLT